MNEQACSTFFPSGHIKTPLWGFTSSGSGEVWIELGRAGGECVQREIIIPRPLWCETWWLYLCVMPVPVYVLSFSRGAGTGGCLWNKPLQPAQSRRGRAAGAAACPACPSCADRERWTGAAGEFQICCSAAALPCLDPRLCHFSAVPLQLGLEWLPVSRSFWNISLYRCAVKGKARCTGLSLQRPSTATHSLPWVRD